MVAEIQIDKDGKRLSHHIERALIRSHARLTYDQVQAVFDGVMDEADCDVPMAAFTRCSAHGGRLIKTGKTANRWR